MKSIFKFFILFSVVFDVYSQNLKSPSDFLGYDIGTQFSRHSQVVDYFNHVSEEMDKNTLLINYGKTYERRPLFYAVISSEANIAEIENPQINYKIFNNLAYGQWTLKEIESGEAWETISHYNK